MQFNSITMCKMFFILFIANLVLLSAVTSAVSPNNQRACVLPPQPANGMYKVSEVKDARPGQILDSFDLTMVCRRGYGIMNDTEGMDDVAIRQIFCVNGQWSQPMPRCVRFCKLEEEPSVTYTCLVPGAGFMPCKRYVPPGWSVRPTCNTPIYYSAESLLYMKCVSGFWDYVAKCKEECGRITPAGEVLLIDGRSAKRGELPWHVAIYRKTTAPYEQMCGGSLVSNDVVLTAAHCFWSDAAGQLPESSFAVAIGKLYRDWNHDNDVGAQTSDIKALKIPKLFQGEQANYQEDIAVVILSTPFIYKPHMRPVCLNFDKNFDRWQLQEGKSGKVAGWGLTAANGEASPILKVADFPFIDENVCVNTLPKSFREYITIDKFCAGYTNGAALCHGDSGGGLAFSDKELGVDRYYLRGIVSSAPSTNQQLCNDATYTAFTKVSKHEDFIKESIAAYTRKHCLGYLFQCNDGTCVDQGSDCNGVKDCEDGSDEADELCNLSALIKTIPGPDQCVIPLPPAHGKIEVANVADTEPGQTFESFLLTVTCEEEYLMMNQDGSIEEVNSQQVFCVRGKWFQRIPTCVRYCRVNYDPTLTLMCNVPGTNESAACDGVIAPGATATPVCNAPNYYSPGPLSPMKCQSDGNWDYAPKCKPECGRITPQGEPLVIGGETAKRGEVPWHVGIYHNSSHPPNPRYICGGTIIANDVVLSAANCFWNDRHGLVRPASEYMVAAGKLYPEWDSAADVDAQKSNIKEMKVPLTFMGSSSEFNSDIAILKLVTPFVFKPYLRPVCLSFDRNLERTLRRTKLGKVAGWGLIDVEGPAADILQVVNMPIHELGVCFKHNKVEFWRYITEKFCAGYTNGTSLCRGDSGGGMTIPADTPEGIERHYLWGIVSIAPRDEEFRLCNAYAYTIFTRVTNHDELIQEYIRY